MSYLWDLICKIEYDILIYRIKGGGNMEFLYKLYSNNYFGIGLFIVITVLAFSFLVILFFGKKDEHKRSKEVEQNKAKEEVNSNTIEVEKQQTIAPLETHTLQEESTRSENDLQPIIEEKSIDLEPVLESNFEEKEELEPFLETPREELDPFVTSNLVLNTDYITNESKDSLEVRNTPFMDNADIYHLDSVMNEENREVEETIDDVLNKYDAIEETILEEPNFQPEEDLETNSTILDEEPEFTVFEKAETAPKNASTPFSSVYLTKEEAPVQKEEIEEPKRVTPTRPTFELPKRVDLPKRTTNAIDESILSRSSEHYFKDENK